MENFIKKDSKSNISGIKSKIEELIKQKATIDEKISFLQISPPKGWRWTERITGRFSTGSSKYKKECVLYQEKTGREINFCLYKSFKKDERFF